MYLPLTDELVCPRCGPEHGLILLADEITERRVMTGTLGCPSCQSRFPVRDGYVDLQGPEDQSEADEEELAVEPEREAAIRLAALMGLAEGVQYALLLGPGVASAETMATLLEGLEVIACSTRVQGWEEVQGVSRFAVGPALPFRRASMGGVALTGPGSGRYLGEAARVLAPAGRLLWDPAPEGASSLLEEAGLRVVAEDANVIVAAQP